MKAIHNIITNMGAQRVVVVNIIKSKNESNSQLGVTRGVTSTGCCKYH